jgi:hypothetical protein
MYKYVFTKKMKLELTVQPAEEEKEPIVEILPSQTTETETNIDTVRLPILYSFQNSFFP